MTKQQIIAIIGEEHWDSFHNWSKRFKLQQYPYGEINYPKQLVEEFVRLRYKETPPRDARNSEES